MTDKPTPLRIAQQRYNDAEWLRLQDAIDDDPDWLVLTAPPRSNQHPLDSFAEVVTNLSIGFVISLLAYAWIINPLFHLHSSPASSTGIVGVFTVISLVRQYVIRRAFNGKSPYAWVMAKVRG